MTNSQWWLTVWIAFNCGVGVMWGVARFVGEAALEIAGPVLCVSVLFAVICQVRTRQPMGERGCD